MTNRTYTSDRECLLALQEFLSTEQYVTPEMDDAFNDTATSDDVDVQMLRQQIMALSDQIGDAWTKVERYLS